MKKYWSTTKVNSRHNSLTKRTKFVLVTVVVAVTLGWVVPQTAAVVAGFFLQPIFLVDRWVREGESVIPRYLRDRSDLQARIVTLENELLLHQADADVIAGLTAENDALRDQLAYSTTSLQVAQVLQQPPLTPYDRLVINRGQQDGIVLDAPVYAGEYVLIGRVIQVSDRSSVVELLSSSGVESTVFVFGPDIYTTAVGQGGGTLRVGVPQGVALEVGNAVSVPAAGLGLLGSIAYVESAATRPEQYGFVSLPVPVASLRYVQVATEPLPTIDFETARNTVASTRDDYFTVPVPEGVLIDIPSAATSSATGTIEEMATSSDTTL
jgi:cell shape-determining protein MreC